MPQPVSLVGQFFTMLEVVSDGPPALLPSGQVKPRSWCRCKCGNPELRLVQNQHLTTFHTKSCGCLGKHGHTSGGKRSRTWLSWKSMRQRCLSPTCTGFYNYGGRGIKICAGLSPFPGFLSVLGECPEGLEIDRWPNNENGNYSCGKCAECLQNGWPLNVRWTTEKEQGRNKRNNTLIEFNGETKCLAAWAEFAGLKVNTLLRRLHVGWPMERALTPLPKQRSLGQP